LFGPTNAPRVEIASVIHRDGAIGAWPWRMAVALIHREGAEIAKAAKDRSSPRTHPGVEIASLIHREGSIDPGPPRMAMAQGRGVDHREAAEIAKAAKDRSSPRTHPGVEIASPGRDPALHV
jgi:hypothetical protein